MNTQSGDDIPLASQLRGSCYKNHLFMGWYFPARELGYRLRWFFLRHRAKECIVKLPVISVSIVAYTALAVAVICYANL